MLGKDLANFNQVEAQNYRICAIFQFEGVHEEIIPSLIYALNYNGYRPRLYINIKCKNQRGNIFSQMKNLHFELFYEKIESHKDWEHLKEEAQRQDVEFICISTFQRDGIAKWATETSKAILGVVHNPKLFLKSQECCEVLASGKLQILTLAHHVAVFLHQRIDKTFIDRVGIVEPIFWGQNSEGKDRTLINSPNKIIAIPGGVNFKTRDHLALLDFLGDQQFRRELEGVVFAILGGGNDRAELEKEATQRGLLNYLNFAPLGLKGQVLYDDYIAILKKATFLHPLTPLSFWHYREHKITSAIPTAIGFNLPMVLDRWTVRTYRVPAFVSDATVASSIACLVQAEKKDITALKESMFSYYEKSLRESAAEVKRLINGIK